MKTLIICFSQTGHTRRVAECIRDGILEVAGPCELVAMQDVDVGTLGDFNLVGLGCPVFYYQEPFNVRQFIEDLPALPDRQWFLFCSHGSVIGNTFPSMTERLQRKGISVIGHHDTYADATLPFYPHPTLTTGHPDEQGLAEARRFGKTIAERSRAIASGVRDLVPELEPIPEEWVKNAEMFTPEFMNDFFPGLSINPDRCSGCRTCEQVCPVHGIDVSIEPPRIQDPCTYCWHCVNQCPEAAIDGDWERHVKLAPKLYKRYRHWLDVAALEGRFRWRMDPDSLDFENPLHRQLENRKHPQPTPGNPKIGNNK